MIDPHARPYGVGLAYRYLIHEGILDHESEIDLLELSTEDYLDRQRRVQTDPQETLLTEALDQFPCVAHGLSLSIGSVEPLDQGYLLGTKRFLESHNLTVFSEHLAFHRFDDRDLTMFLELPFEEDAVQWIKRNYHAVRNYLGRPFALENVTYPFAASRPSLQEAEFFSRIAEETDCSFLLDVTNLFNNAHNHGYEIGAFLDRYPLDRVTQLHLAGGHEVDGQWEDSHSHPVMDPVWELYEEVLERTTAEIVIVERDSRFDPFDRVMEDVGKARECFYAHRPQVPDAPTPHQLFSPNPSSGRDNGSSDPFFANLRGFQQAVMHRITDPDYRETYYRDPEAILASLSVSPEWKQRVTECDLREMAKLEQSWDGLSRIYREEEEQFEKDEWASWARVLESEAVPS
ncbi:MAG: DUF692 domain-containing protein [Verrucomicrobiota bacterium]